MNLYERFYMYLFGFGSLVNIKSAQNSFKNRELKKEDLIPVKIRGYKRVWNSIESICFEKEIVNGIFLNIQKDENSYIFGVMIKISEEEFEVLKLREKNYSCVTIKKESVINQKLDDDLIAFMTTKDDKIAKIGQENCFIPSRYIEIVKEGVKNFSKEFQDNFEDIFSNFPFEIKEGIYTFSDPIQNQAAKNSKRL
ncbi:gamma-glutamylcyclotransferase [Aliarcobacter cryaerophilus]|uniref:gamma-glutamylcyclotransferase n=2 Tax=Aliarcobacter cryaerophilus TaxID=28198 RepID=UPI001652110A|nr:gamma-glutamylcyclotransferase [Aliarcobacter cryaerophilus]